MVKNSTILENFKKNHESVGTSYNIYIPPECSWESRGEVIEEIFSILSRTLDVEEDELEIGSCPGRCELNQV